MDPQRIVDVAVIGAGFAGLSCAGRLLNAFPQDVFGSQPGPALVLNPSLTVAIIEARDRIGGRAFSQPLEPAVRGAGEQGVAALLPAASPSRFDLGASWLHESCAANPFTSLIRTLGAKTFLHADLNPSVLFDGPEGRRFAREEIVRARQQAHEVLEAAKTARPRDGEADRPLSADVALPLELTESEKRAARWFLHETEQLLATSFDVLSGAHWDDYAETCWQGPDEFVVESIGAVVEKLAEYVQASPRASLRLNSPVKQIRKRDEDGLIEILVCGNSAAGQPDTRVLARKVVCTIPLGVLKADTVAFSPPLRERKQQAIASLGVGLMNKVILEYDTCFWREEDLVFGHTSNTWGEYPWFINLKKETGRNVIVCFLVGSAAANVEALADAQTVAEMHKILSAMYPETTQDVRAPSAFLVTRWSQDPYSRGSYAMYQVGSSASDCHEFEVPEWDSSLFFAGEHMSWNEQGFVHGAILTGLKAADAILGLDRKTRSLPRIQGLKFL